MPWTKRLAAALLASALAHPSSAAAAAPGELLIAPPGQLGPLHLPATEAEVMRAFPGQAEPEEIDLPAGAGLSRGTALFPCDLARAADVYYSDAAHGRHVAWIDIGRFTNAFMGVCGRTSPDPWLKDQLPGDVQPISARDEQLLGAAWRPDLAELQSNDLSPARPPPLSAWHLENGIRPGMSVQALARLNGAPFDIMGPAGQTPGLADWAGGHLANCAWQVVIKGSLATEGSTIRYTLADPFLAATTSWVEELRVRFDQSCEDRK